MKTLFKKFKASIALDRGGQSARQDGADDARCFEESLRTMDRRLREPRAGNDIPPSLHGSIMRAVQTSNRVSEPALMTFFWPRLAAAALVLAIGVGVFWSLNRPVKVADAASLTKTAPSLAAAIEQGQALTQAAPKAALGPLSGEWDLLNGDFQNAMKFVVASVP